MAATITNEEWDEWSHENFDTMALLRVFDAVRLETQRLERLRGWQSPTTEHSRAKAAPICDGRDQPGCAHPRRRKVLSTSCGGS